ncbi:hypothetical protein XA68_12105 [Ophiocordyceps unilateralis]|uniref:Uncharacterized protein n=1 Tax=Ophiocordyceps unilateralis TaxID=268505 RepID=A0A2A9PE69_OPHUN|nr:hypothetical protein XA68_12105 [Ophiocordyceps unilateralis]
MDSLLDSCSLSPQIYYYILYFRWYEQLPIISITKDISQTRDKASQKMQCKYCTLNFSGAARCCVCFDHGQVSHKGVFAWTDGAVEEEAKKEMKDATRRRAGTEHLSGHGHGVQALQPVLQRLGRKVLIAKRA